MIARFLKNEPLERLSKPSEVEVELRCQYCEAEEILPFRCPFCGGYFCADHRLPEMHDCPEIRGRRCLAHQMTEEEPDITKVPSGKENYYRFKATPSQPMKFLGFSPKEVTHLVIGTSIVIGVGLSMFFQIYQLPTISQFKPDALVGMALVFTMTFILHEIAHKIAAQHYGLWAEFRLSLFGSLITLFSIFSPIKLVSPGVVQIVGVANKEAIGKISLAGPAVNLALSLIFVPLNYYLKTFFIFAGAILNPWVALVNLIPLGAFDGEKIFWWNKKAWALCFTASLILTFLALKFSFFPRL